MIVRMKACSTWSGGALRVLLVTAAATHVSSVGAHATLEAADRAAFAQWAERHRPNGYANPNERQERFRNFQRNLRELARLARASPLAAYAPDALADLFVEERAQLSTGARTPRFLPTTSNTEVIEFTEPELQRAFAAGPIDWRFRGAVTPPTSQGRCSTCAYFAGVAAVEGAWKLAGHPLVKLSEQEEIDCYNNADYAMLNILNGIARAADAPLANHSDPNITGCRGITNCSYAKAHAFAYINGTRGSKTHNDPDVLALLRSGPVAVSIDAGPYNGCKQMPTPHCFDRLSSATIAAFINSRLCLGVRPRRHLELLSHRSASR